jgi:hypothetical protein
MTIQPMFCCVLCLLGECCRQDVVEKSKSMQVGVDQSQVLKRMVAMCIFLILSIAPMAIASELGNF